MNHRQDVAITSEVKSEVCVIHVTYPDRSLLHEIKAKQLTSDVLREYRRQTESSDDVRASCIVVLKAAAANSAVVYMLYALYKECKTRKGLLFIVGYPKDSIQTLATLGFTSVFRLNASVDSAIREARSVPSGDGEAE